MGFSRLFIICFIMLVFCRVSANVTNLKAKFSKGKTYITFTQDPGSNDSYKYNVYRSNSVITDVSGMTPVFNVRHNSTYDKRYAEAFELIDYGKYFMRIEDEGQPLDSTTGLFVYTPKADESAYYAATFSVNGVENTAISSGINSLSSAVQEEYWEWPMGVYIGKHPYRYCDSYIYYYWMDYSDWNHNSDYYGHVYTVKDQGRNASKNTQNMPLTVHIASYHPIVD
ncbi:MAG: hypothetical protein ABIA63_00975, partial [bacterium]